jgi:protein tyrosine/serine phosphatase
VKYSLSTPQNRRKAEQDFLWSDHAFLRAGFQNAHKVFPQVWRSSQPSPTQLAGWKDRGVRSVISLRGDTDASFTVLEKEACANLGLSLHFLTTRSRAAPTRDWFVQARALFEQVAYPALLHCKSGADRAGMASVFYLHVMRGLDLDDALRHLDLSYLHLSTGPTGILDFFWKEWAEARDAGAGDFWVWLENDYCPDDLKARFRPKPVGTWLTEQILRSE